MFGKVKYAIVGYLIAAIVVLVGASYLRRDAPWWLNLISLFALVVRKIRNQFAKGFDWLQERVPTVESELLAIESSSLPEDCRELELSEKELAEAVVIRTRVRVRSASGADGTLSWHPEAFVLGAGAGPTVGDSLQQLRGAIQSRSGMDELSKAAEEIETSVGGWRTSPNYYRACSESGEIILDNSESADERYSEEVFEGGLAVSAVVESFFVLLLEDLDQIRDVIWIMYGPTRKHHFMLADVAGDKYLLPET